MAAERSGTPRKSRARARILVPIIILGLLLIAAGLYIISPVPAPTPYGEKTTRGEFMRQFLEQNAGLTTPFLGDKVKGADVPVSPRQNSFHDLLIAARWWKRFEGPYAELWRERDALLAGEPTEVSKDLREYIAQNEQSLAVLKKAVRERCITPEGESFADELPYLGPFRELARGLATRARIREIDGDPAAAYDDYLDVMRLGNCCAQGDVTIIHGLIGVAIHAIGGNAMKPGIRSLPEPVLDQVVSGLREVESSFAPLKAVLGGELKVDGEAIEYAMKARGNLGLVSEYASGWGYGGGEEPSASKIRTNLLWLYTVANRPRTRANFQRFKAALLEYADSPLSVSSAPLAQLEKEIAAADYINRQALPALTRVNEQGARDRARIRGLLLRAAVELYQRRQGKYPESLQALTETGILSAIPDDPFDGQMFRYIPSAEGGKVYSVGRDLVNDQAKIEWDPGKKGSDKGDWVF